MGISVSDYLVFRLQKLGVNEFFGLPGDYNFNILKSIENNPKTKWIGCTNELNAGYAADGYARIRGVGAIVTTYGVGELSAINAVAGSMSESVPVVKITGLPDSKFIKSNALIHHNLNTPNYKAFINAYSNVVETAVFLTKDNAKEEIDKALNVLIKEKKPVYIAIPMDVCNLIIDDNFKKIEQKSDKNNLNLALKETLKIINNAKQPFVLADVMVKRFNATKELHRFLTKSNYPVATLLMGKDLINNDEFLNYLGTYVGKFGNPKAYDNINNSDCPIFIGTVISDINTQGFDLKFNPNDYINIQGNYCIVKNTIYKNVLMKDFLYELSKKITKKDYKKIEYDYIYKKIDKKEKVNMEYFYSKLQDFIQEGDSLVVETGIVNLALAKLKIKKNVSVNNQVLWGSIGWATGATLGISMALKNARTILVTGEGSHQLSAVEISTIMRNNLKPIIFVINNDGYTIERILCDNPKDKYNEIAKWNYSKLPLVFGENVYSACIETCNELDEVFEIIKKEQKDKMCYIELKFDMFDLPELAKKAIAGSKFEKYSL